jgi:hypothetical protein
MFGFRRVLVAVVTCFEVICIDWMMVEGWVALGGRNDTNEEPGDDIQWSRLRARSSGSGPRAATEEPRRAL